MNPVLLKALILIRIPIIVPIKEKGVINQGSGVGELVLRRGSDRDMSCRGG